MWIGVNIVICALQIVLLKSYIYTETGDCTFFGSSVPEQPTVPAVAAAATLGVRALCHGPPSGCSSREIIRGTQADDPFAFAEGEQVYVLRSALGGQSATLRWDHELLGELAALHVVPVAIPPWPSGWRAPARVLVDDSFCAERSRADRSPWRVASASL